MNKIQQAFEKAYGPRGWDLSKHEGESEEMLPMYRDYYTQVRYWGFLDGWKARKEAELAGRFERASNV